MANPVIPTATLQAALSEAEREQQAANEAAQTAIERQGQANDVVNSLKRLLAYRTIEMATLDHAQAEPIPPPPAQTDGANDGTAGTLIDWFEKSVSASGDRGMSVPEIVTLAMKSGVKMHPNYPYTALRSLVKSDRLKKVGLRYYRPSGGQLALVG